MLEEVVDVFGGLSIIDAMVELALLLLELKGSRPRASRTSPKTYSGSGLVTGVVVFLLDGLLGRAGMLKEEKENETFAGERLKVAELGRLSMALVLGWGTES